MVLNQGVLSHSLRRKGETVMEGEKGEEGQEEKVTQIWLFIFSLLIMF